jgi:DNA polymerase-1
VLTGLGAGLANRQICDLPLHYDDEGNMQKLVLIDGHALAYRAYFALQTTGLSTSRGEPTHAVYGFCLMLLAVLEDEHPDYLAVTFDVGETFRHQQYSEYKATRDKAPEDLHQQVGRIGQVIEAFGLPVLTAEGYEADDVLGTIAGQAETQNVDTLIVTGDRDTFQLITPLTKVLISGRRFSDREIYDEARVAERYGGLRPPQLVDMKGLTGDTSDNIPGVKGIGDKTAIKLLNAYETLEGIYEHLDEVSGRFRAKLEEGREIAFLSRDLGRIVTNAPVELDLNACRVADYDRDAVKAIFQELEFRSLMQRLPATADTPQQLAMFEPETDQAFPTQTIIVQDETALQELVAKLKQAPLIAFDTETTDPDPIRADLVGISLAVEEGKGYYIPVGHDAGRQIPKDHVLNALRPIFTDPKRPLTAHNASYDVDILEEAGVKVAGLAWDTMIAEWLISPIGEHGLKSVAFRRLGVEMTPITDLIGTGSKKITMAQVPIEKAAPYAAADADMTLRLVPLQEPELEKANARPLFDEVEMPLVPVIVGMERAGIELNSATLNQMGSELGERLDAIEADINAFLDPPININSTQQLSQALFEQLALPADGISKTKSGHYSTAASVLERLKGEHPIIELILEHREISKLLGTYVAALPKLVNPRTGRIHTSFNQTGAVTGRISSSNPNLQNIPMRTEQGRKVRRAFVAAEGWRLVAADYSQVELRVLAHLCEDPALIDAFRNDMDIHATTAAVVYGVDFDSVSVEQRSFAKRVNFGLLYGMSSFRLAQETGMPRAEADRFVREYFDRFPGVEKYLTETKRQAAEKGYVETLMGRRRYFPALTGKAKGRTAAIQRAAAEREAINMPVQGSAADIMKVAMRGVYDKLAEGGYSARLLLQVHDELVLEVPVDELNQIVSLVRDQMRTAYELVVPLKVDVKIGQNWYEMEAA